MENLVRLISSMCSFGVAIGGSRGKQRETDEEINSTGSGTQKEGGKLRDEEKEVRT